MSGQGGDPQFSRHLLSAPHESKCVAMHIVDCAWATGQVSAIAKRRHVADSSVRLSTMSGPEPNERPGTLSRSRGVLEVEARSQTLAEFVADWLPTVRIALRPSTWESYRCNLTHHVLPRLGDIALNRLAPLHLNRLYAELLASGRVDGSGGLSHKTVHYVHTIVHRCLGDAMRWGLIDNNPAELCAPPRQVRPEVSAWDAHEAKRFLCGVRQDRLYALYVVALTTGMRRGELLGLSWDSVDLDQRRLFVRQLRIGV